MDEGHFPSSMLICFSNIDSPKSIERWHV